MRRCAGQLIQFHASGSGDETGRMDEVGGFVHAAPEGFGAEVGGVRFQHDAVFRAPARGFRHHGGVFKGGHPGEGDHAVQFVKNSSGLGRVSDEAVEHGAHAARVVPGNRQGVFKASGPFPVPRVQDNVEAQARRQVKVLFQQVLLKAAEAVSLPAPGGSVEVVQPRFPDGGQGDILRHAGKAVRPALRRFMGVVRMDAQRAKDHARELARPRRVRLPVIRAGSQRNHAINAFPEGMLHIGFPAGLVELRGSQMAVRVNNHGVKTLAGQGKSVDISRF